MYKRAMLRWGQCLYAITVEFALKITICQNILFNYTVSSAFDRS